MRSWKPRLPASPPKRGFLDKLLGRDEETEELMIPGGPCGGARTPARRPGLAACAVCPAAPAEDTQTQEVWRSKVHPPGPQQPL